MLGDDPMPTSDAIFQFLRLHWEAVLLGVTWLGILLVALRRRRDWRRKRFVQQVNFSLNEVVDGTLLLRTLLEDSAEHVWLNAYGVGRVRKAAERTTVDQPFLRMAWTQDMSYVKRAVVNVLSERLAPVFVARALGAPVRTGRFVFGITWERYGNIRTQKLRVIIIERETLLTRFDPSHPAYPPAVASAAHRDRIRTLTRLRELATSKKERLRRLVGEVELGVLLSPADETTESPPALPPALPEVPEVRPAPAGDDQPEPPPLPPAERADPPA